MIAPLSRRRAALIVVDIQDRMLPAMPEVALADVMRNGVHKLQRPPEPVRDAGVALSILVVSIALEGWSTLGNIRAMNQRRGATGFFRYLRATKDSDLIVVFGENSAAVLGLTFAMPRSAWPTRPAMAGGTRSARSRSAACCSWSRRSWRARSRASWSARPPIRR